MAGFDGKTGDHGMKNLTTAIFGKLSGSSLSTDIGGRLYKGRAPEGAVYPYVVYFVVSDLPEYPGTKTIERVRIQFSLYSADQSSTAEIEDMLTYLRSLYDDCSLTITSNTLIYFIRGNLATMREDHTTLAGTIGVWHYAQEYDVMIVRT